MQVMRQPDSDDIHIVSLNEFFRACEYLALKLLFQIGMPFEFRFGNADEFELI